MLVQLTVHLKVSGRGITLYTSANEARPDRGHADASCVTTTASSEPTESLSRYG
jgi:hypothetical protein